MFDSVRQIIELRLFASKFYTITESDLADGVVFNNEIFNGANAQFPGLGLTNAQLIALNGGQGNLNSMKFLGSKILVEASTEVTSFPLFVEGRQFVQPTNDNFAILSILDSVSVGREFGNAKGGRRRSGSTRLKLYAPHGTGTKIIRDMADELDVILAYTAGDSNTGNGGTLFMKAGSLTQVSENTDGFLEYNLDYIYDYYTS